MELWTREFQKKGIPSSFRDTPSNSVLWFEEYIRSHSLKPARLLDLGSGLGRNAIHLAKSGFQVSCLDMLDANIQHIKQTGLKIDARCHDLSTPFPYAEEEFDYAIDVFCFTHLVTGPAIQNYIQELKRVLKKGGIYHLSLASTEDGFYGPLLTGSPRPQDRLVIDPNTQIPSILYQRKEIEKLFSNFTLLEFFEKRNMGPMHGKLYSRRILSFIFKLGSLNEY